MRVWNQWTDEYQTSWKTENGARTVISKRDDRHIARIALVGRTASSSKLAAHRSTITGVSLSASSIH